MAIFKRKTNGTEALERELATTRERRDRLKEQRIDAQRALDIAIAERRRTLVEVDADDGLISKDIVRGARDLVEQLDDAIAHLDARITEIEHKIAAEQERAKREQAAGELARYADQLSAAIDAFAMTVAPLAKTIPDVVGRTPHANLDFGRGVEQLLGGVVAELGGVVGNAKAHAAALLTGETMVIRQPTAIEVLGQPPQIERLSCMPIADVGWIENGQPKTAPSWSIWALPLDVARRGIEAGWLFAADSETVARLRAGGFSVGNAWHAVDVRRCVDLSAEKLPKPPPGSLGRSLGEIDQEEKPAGVPGVPGGAVERVGEAVTGTATVT
jgi:hypothetical protein